MRLRWVAVYVMLGAPYEFVGLMDNLQDRGILDAGEYFVIGVCLEPYYPENPETFLEGKTFFGQNLWL